MQAVERLSSYITRGVFTFSGPFHPFGGAVDIIVVQQQDGSFKSSPWYVRFGKFQGVLKTKEKVVNICVNGTEAGFNMYLDHKGEAYFLDDPILNGELVMSPPTSGDETDWQSKKERLNKTKNRDFDRNENESVVHIDMGNGKILSRTNSRRSRIFGLMFGRRSMKDNDSVGAVQRKSSLERAEIAADLLEMRWSTNLPTDTWLTGTPKKPCDDDGRDASVAEKDKNSSTLSSHGVFHCNETVGSNMEGVDDNFGTNFVTSEPFGEKTSCNSSHLEAHEEFLKIYSSDTLTPQTEECNTVSKESIFRDPIGVVLSSNIDEVSSDTRHTSDDSYSHLTAGVTMEESGDEQVSSVIYCETMEGSSITSEVNLRTEDGRSAANENSRICSHESLQMYSDGSYPKTDSVSGTVLESSSVSSMNTSSPFDSVQKLLPVALSSLDFSLHGSESIQSEDLDIRAIHFLGKQSHTEDKELTMLHRSVQVYEDDKQLNFGEEVTQLDAAIEKAVHESGVGVQSEAITEELVLLKAPASFLKHDEDLISSEEAGMQTSCMVPESCLVNGEVDEAGKIKGVNKEFCTEISAANFPLAEVANASVPIAGKQEDIQFEIRDIENFCGHQNSEQSKSAKAVGTGDHLLLPECTIDENVPNNIASEPNIEVSTLASTFWTSPMRIPKSRAQVGEGERLVRSLPSIRSHIHDLESSVVLHPLSRSLQSNLKSFEWCTHNNVHSSSSKLETDSERNLVEVQCKSDAVARVVDIQGQGSQNDMPNKPVVEISLCRHLLFEGMGTEAASQAFDSEKVDSEKFSALGPLLVKNDRLAVRICGLYFPWDAAAPIILGMISFGQEHIFEPEGMIAINQIEKTIEGDGSMDVTPSVGNWRLWPFGLKKSKTTATVRSAAPDRTKGTKPDSTSDGTEKLSDDNIPVRATKKKVRSVTPTSEQLASLNLKEGRNVVTFSFSTAMLGRQQVDARIYLWKWNTRIVVSDVDGTITKSDVLGQFMPLVGKDWSQTGVTHLFSAIKENGYQFLFLSARAISQAYLTRQFLFNLKQDGKALPDGPVVISPDGLFPSLYREVIRKAPHEFKISCLEDIRALFPPDCNPFYAGFGNRYTDEISYLKVGIPKGKIFTINPKGEVAVNHRVDTKSYTSLHALVNGMFPVMFSTEQEDFNSWNYWKLPLPNIDS